MDTNREVFLKRLGNRFSNNCFKSRSGWISI